MITTWNQFLDSWLWVDNRLIWIFDSISSFPKTAKEWNRVILLNGNSFQYKNKKRVDLWQFVMPQWPMWPQGPIGESGKDGKDGNDWINWRDWINWLQWPVGSVWEKWDKWDTWIVWSQWPIWPQWPMWPMWPQWPIWLQGTPGINGRDGIDGKDWIAPKVEDIVASIINNPTFISKCSIPWPKWKDWESVSISDVVFNLLQNKEFLNQCKIKWDKWDKFTFNELTKEQKAEIKWDTWEWVPWPMWPKWFDWDRIFIMYSPDGKTNRSYKVKDWDKFISIQVWKQEAQVAQFIFK